MRRPMLPRNRTNRDPTRRLQTRMRVHLLLMMTHARLRNRTHVALLRLRRIRMIRRQDGRRGPDNGADGVVHGFALGLLEGGLQGGALGCGGGGERDGGVLVQVVVVVGGGADDGAGLLEIVSGGEGGEGGKGTWPSWARSTSGWLGGRTELVEPMTGQAAAEAMVNG